MCIPKMMTKVILYAYSKKIYSSRGIEETLTEHIPSMWLAAGQQPDHRTINRFRSKHLKAMMDSLFEQMIHQLIEQNDIIMENYFLDGTKIEAEAMEEQIVTLTEAIDLEEDTGKRKELRSKRSQWKKPVKGIREDFLPRLAKYHQHPEILGDRNSFSKTVRIVR